MSDFASSAAGPIVGTASPISDYLPGGAANQAIQDQQAAQPPPDPQPAVAPAASVGNATLSAADLSRRTTALVAAYPDLKDSASMLTALAGLPIQNDSELLDTVGAAKQTASAGNAAKILAALPAGADRYTYWNTLPQATQEAVQQTGMAAPTNPAAIAPGQSMTKRSGPANVGAGLGMSWLGRQIGGLVPGLAKDVSSVVKPVQDAAAGALGFLGSLPGHTYRFLDYNDPTGQALPTGYGQTDPGNITRPQTSALERLSPAYIAKRWAATAPDKTFVTDKALTVARQQTGGDPQALALVAATALAGGDPTAGVSRLLGPSPTDPTKQADYTKQATALHTIAQQPGFAEAVKAYTAGQVSYGRDVARNLGLSEGSVAFKGVSGAADATYDWYTDPLSAAGKVANVARVSRALTSEGAIRSAVDGARLSDDQLAAVAKLGSASDGQAAWLGNLADVPLGNGGTRIAAGAGAPDGIAGLLSRGIPAAEDAHRARAAAVIAEALNTNDPVLLTSTMKGGARTFDSFQSYAKEMLPDKLATETSRGSFTANDVLDFYNENAGRDLLGTPANAQQFNAVELPRLSGTGLLAARARYGAKSLAELADNATPLGTDATMLTPVQQGADAVVNADRSGFWRLAASPLQPIARAGRLLSPITDGLVTLTGPEATDSFSRFVSQFVPSTSEHDAWLRTWAAADGQAARRDVVLASLRRGLERLGYGATDDGQKFIDNQVELTRTGYGVNGHDVLPNGVHATVDPDTQDANMLAVPHLQALAQAARKTNIADVFHGGLGNDTFTRFIHEYWAPLSILRPAFAARAVGEEIFTALGRLSPSEIANSYAGSVYARAVRTMTAGYHGYDAPAGMRAMIADKLAGIAKPLAGHFLDTNTTEAATRVGAGLGLKDVADADSAALNKLIDRRAELLDVLDADSPRIAKLKTDEDALRAHLKDIFDKISRDPFVVKAHNAGIVSTGGDYGSSAALDPTMERTRQGYRAQAYLPLQGRNAKYTPTDDGWKEAIATTLERSARSPSTQAARELLLGAKPDSGVMNEYRTKVFGNATGPSVVADTTTVPWREEGDPVPAEITTDAQFAKWHQPFVAKHAEAQRANDEMQAELDRPTLLNDPKVAADYFARRKAYNSPLVGENDPQVRKLIDDANAREKERHPEQPEEITEAHQAAQTLKAKNVAMPGEHPIPEGHTRLWRGEAAGLSAPAPLDGDHEATLQGQWYTDQPWTPHGYADTNTRFQGGGEQRVRYLDIPTDQVGTYQASRYHDHKSPHEHIPSPFLTARRGMVAGTPAAKTETTYRIDPGQAGALADDRQLLAMLRSHVGDVDTPGFLGYAHAVAHDPDAAKVIAGKLLQRNVSGSESAADVFGPMADYLRAHAAGEVEPLSSHAIHGLLARSTIPVHDLHSPELREAMTQAIDAAHHEPEFWARRFDSSHFVHTPEGDVVRGAPPGYTRVYFPASEPGATVAPGAVPQAMKAKNQALAKDLAVTQLMAHANPHFPSGLTTDTHTPLGPWGLTGDDGYRRVKAVAHALVGEDKAVVTYRDIPNELAAATRLGPTIPNVAKEYAADRSAAGDMARLARRAGVVPDGHALRSHLVGTTTRLDDDHQLLVDGQHANGVSEDRASRLLAEKRAANLADTWAPRDRVLAAPLAATMDKDAHQVRIGAGELSTYSDADLPTQVFAPSWLALPRDDVWDRVRKFGYQKVIGPAVDSMVRQPLLIRNYARALTAQHIVGTEARLMASAETDYAKALAAHLGWDEPRLADAAEWDRAHAKDYRHLSDDDIPADVKSYLFAHQDDGGFTPPEGGPDLSKMGDWLDRRENTREVLAQAASERAIRETVPYVNNHGMRSNLSELSRNYAPFLWAQESMWRRWTRAAIQSPQVFERLEQGVHGLAQTGLVHKDPRTGQNVMSIPGSASMTRALANLGLPFSVDASVPLTMQVAHMVPGVNNPAQVPFGPNISVAADALLGGQPEYAGILRSLNGGIAPKPGAAGVLSQLVPAGWLRNTVQAMATSPDSSTIAAARLQAMHQLALNGYAPPPDATDAQVHVWAERVNHYTRNFLVTRAALGFITPTAADADWNSVDTHAGNVGGLSDELNNLIGQYGYNEGVTRFVKAHPDADALTVTGQTGFDGGLRSPATAAAGAMLDAHPDFFAAHPNAAAFVLPSMAETNTTLDPAVARAELARGLRVELGADQLAAKVAIGAGAQGYYQLHDAYQKRLAATVDPSARAKEQALWQQESKQYLAANPLFATELQGHGGSQSRADALADVRNALGEGSIPNPQAATELGWVMNQYNAWVHSDTSLAGRRTTASSQARAHLALQLARTVKPYVATHPYAAQFYDRVIRPEIAASDRQVAAILNGASQ